MYVLLLILLCQCYSQLRKFVLYNFFILNVCFPFDLIMPVLQSSTGNTTQEESLLKNLLCIESYMLNL